MSTIGLALIAKNEEERLPQLLASIEGAFDEVVLIDTGSTDNTLEVFRKWGAKQPKTRCFYDYFTWIKDFGAARTFAQSKLTTDWEVWADCDDVIVGAQNLRAVAEQAPPEVAAFVAGYNYAQHPQTGESICYLKRERMVRRGMGKWVNRVHEAQIVGGPVLQLERQVAEWVHCKQASSVEQIQKEDARRNLDILESWVKDEPTNTRVLAYLGTEHAARGELDEAMGWFKRYVAANPEWDEEHAQVLRKKAMCHLLTGEFDEAINEAFQAIRLLPQWTDSYITLAEAYFSKADYVKAIEWSREALRRGEPDTLLIINPLDYTFQPRKILAGALAELGQLDEAIRVGQEAFQLNPADEALAQALNSWRIRSKREHTANTIAMLAQQLIAHDEQLKALIFLTECVPHFALDHPGIVQLRSMLRERIDWVNDPRSLLAHYEDGGSKPEDFLDDDALEKVPAQLPRVAFLYEGVFEQLTERHHEQQIAAAGEQVTAALDTIR